MSTYPNTSIAALGESLKIAAACTLVLLSACNSSESNDSSYANIDENLLTEMDVNEADLNTAEASLNSDLNASTDDSANAAVPTCASVPANGELLVDNRQRREEGHILEIDNGTQGDAIIKVRNANTDRTLASFFVARGSKASLRRIPDGRYRVQYMVGDKLGVDCRKFIDGSANEFPGPETLTTEDLGDRIRVSTLSYTLYAVPGGNTTPQPIPASDFDKP